MKILTHRWIQYGPHEIGVYKTTVTIIHPSVTTAVTLCGHKTRKEAILAAHRHLHREQRWSNQFLCDLYDTAVPRTPVKVKAK